MSKTGWLALIVALAGLGGVALLVAKHISYSNWLPIITAESAGWKTSIEANPIISVPSEFELHVVVTRPDGAVSHEEKFSGGWRMMVTTGALSAHGEAGPGLLELQSQPVRNGGWVSRQYYRVQGGRLWLVRLEDPSGKIEPNFYSPLHYTIGPKVPEWKGEEWARALASNDPGQVLGALVWLGGVHSEPTAPPPNANSESLESASLVKSVRAKPEVKRQLGLLKDSSNPWIAEAAKLALEERISKDR
jgi:hypothetical protein